MLSYLNFISILCLDSRSEKNVRKEEEVEIFEFFVVISRVFY